jgi:DNA-directed RNA polymerase specialized sigma subunit
MEVSAVKNWEQDLYIYQIHPVPPKKEDLQEYIDLYISEQDDKYIMWFLHYYEPVLNSTTKEAIERYSMKGHFADIKQACVTGIFKALQSYDKDVHGSFITYKVRIMWNEIHEYIRQMRTGLTVPSENKYRTLRQIMRLYGEYGYSTEAIRKIAKEVNLSVKNVKEILLSGIENMNIVDFYVSYADEETEEMLTDITSDTDFEPLRVLLATERFNYVKAAFERLNYRERLVVSEYLAFCPDCFKLKPEKTKLSEIALKLCLSPDAIENEYKKAIKKMRKYLEEKLL